ncbi:hypothetical protein SD37_18230 [Amycolatopsis orientalis]|uniref:GerMN domain-containing protein n=1 Tax=Amycolatopsis orientalis TaxID=31958 RepID=A0A193BYZ2_AMYOR|nr:GerMN domain-containing protein [Amycolatopsis orientalis]ANN17389.1 hypothetical protein SD37_18230 [Amycolatopsis orientalis]
MRNPRLVPRLIALALLAPVAAGCGVRPSGVILGAPAPEGPSAGVVLYFLSAGEPVRVPQRPHPGGVTLARTIELLAAGPDGDEGRQGYTTEVPAGTAVLGQTAAGDGVIVTLSVDVAGLSVRATEQLVCTVRDALDGTAKITLRGGATERGPLSCPVAGQR